MAIEVAGIVGGPGDVAVALADLDGAATDTADPDGPGDAPQEVVIAASANARITAAGALAMLIMVL